MFIENEYSFSVEENTLLKFNLYKDRDLDSSDIEKIKSHDAYEYGLMKALSFLSRRPRSRQETENYLQTKLGSKKLGEADRQRVLDLILNRLETLEYLDDTAFADWLIKSRTSQRKRSEKAVVQELLKFGVNEDIYVPILKQHYNKDAKSEIITKLATRKLKSSKIQGLGAKEKERKVMEYLLRKGFNYDDIKPVLNKLHF